MATLSEVREQADAALSAGDHSKALSLTLLMQRHFPRDYQTLELLGKLHLEGRRLRESRDLFGQVLGIDPENVLARAALAMIAEEEGDLEEALEQFGRAFDVNPGNHEIAAEIARLHSQLKHSKPAEPGSSMHATARRFMMENRYENAVPWLQEALRQAPVRTDVAVGLVRALWLDRRPVEAGDVAGEILAEHRDCLPALAVSAVAALSHGDSEAVALLARTSELDPGNAVAKELFAKAGMVFPELDERLEIPDAELQEAMRSAVDAPPDNGFARTSPTNPTASEAEAIEASGADSAQPHEAPPDVDQSAGHMVAAARHAAVGEIELALAEYRAALNLDPSIAHAVGSAALALLEAVPGNVHAHWLAGDTMAMEGQFRRAVEQYLSVLKAAGETRSLDPNTVHLQE